MKIKLYKHQKEGIKFLKKKKTAALLCEPGTGKTLMMIRRLEDLVDKGRVRRILIVSPIAVVPNWKQELKTFWKNKDSIGAMVWEGTPTKRKDYPKLIKGQLKPTIVLINYDKVRLDKKLLMRCGFDCIVCDESQKIMHRNSGQSRAIRSLGKKATYRYIMTGTPMSTGYENYWSQFLFMDDKVFGTRFQDFQDEYCQMGGFQGKQIVGYNNVKKLKRKIEKKSFIVRKEDCLDLPPVIENKRYFELSPKARKAYKELDKELMTEVEGIDCLDIPFGAPDNIKETIDYILGCIEQGYTIDKDGPQSDFLVLENALVKTMKLQQITGGFVKNTETEKTMLIDKGKLNLLQEVIESHPGEQIVIFCKYRAEIDTIMKLYPKAVELSGKTKDKGIPVKQFQEGKAPIIVVQLKTGSAGINLTKGSVVIFYSWSASYIDMRQARDRLDRIGQKNKINLYYLIAKDTIDESSLEVLKERERMSKKIL